MTTGLWQIWQRKPCASGRMNTSAGAQSSSTCTNADRAFMADWRHCSRWPTRPQSVALGSRRPSGWAEQSREIEQSDSFERCSVVTKSRLGLTWSWCPSENSSTPVWLPLRANTVTTSNGVSGVPRSPARGASLAARGVLTMLGGYKLLISPYFAGTCRFVPSCADYARDAVLVHGPFRGSWLALRRLVRCQPMCSGGHDPVPGK